MNETLNAFKGWFIAFGTAISSFLGILAVPVYVLIGLEIFDYITGIVSAKYRNQKIDSSKGMRGIMKKLGMLSLVAGGSILDWLIMYAGNIINIHIKAKFIIASLVAMWLICNEFISILENLKDIGVPFPSFMSKLIENVKSSVEQQGDSLSEVDDNGNENSL